MCRRGAVLRAQARPIAHFATAVIYAVRTRFAYFATCSAARHTYPNLFAPIVSSKPNKLFLNLLFLNLSNTVGLFGITAFLLCRTGGQ